MKVFPVRNFSTEREIMFWCWHNIGHGGAALKGAVGCQGFEDWWDGDKWKIYTGIFGRTEICIKEDIDATLYALRWQ